MGYYIAGAGNPYIAEGEYYEGSQLYSTDTSVTQRPHPVCTWTGSAWTYPLPATRDFQKAKFFRAMEADLAAGLADQNTGLVDLIAFASGVHEANRLADNPSATDAEVPLLKGYSTQASITKAAANTIVKSAAQFSMEIIGQFYAYKVGVFAAIDASSSYADILAMDYVRPV